MNVKKLFIFIICFLPVLFAAMFISCENPVLVNLTGLYSISFETNGGSEVEGYRTDLIETSPVTSRDKFLFAGWYEKSDFSSSKIEFPYEPVKNVTLYASWTDAMIAEYKVEHYKQNLNLDTEPETYELAFTEELSGKKESETLAVPEAFEGFHSRNFYQDTIRADGSTVIKIYYDRNDYTVTFNPNGAEGTAFQQIFYYGVLQSLQQNCFSNSGYYFGGWSEIRNGTAVYSDEENFEAKTDITLYAVWNKYPLVNYKVLHYFQTTAPGSSYQLRESETQTLSGRAEGQTKAEAKKIEGFTARTFNQEIINKDGSTVVKIYYNRNKYTVTFNANYRTGCDDEEESDSGQIAETAVQTQDFYYGVEQALKANSFSRVNRTFTGWSCCSDGSVDFCDKELVLINADVTLYAVWSYGGSVTEATIDNLELSNLDEPFTIKVSGIITDETLYDFAQKIESANQKVTLDLSETTGLVSLSTKTEGTSVFKNCYNLTAIILPETLTTIGANVFKDCAALSSVIIPSSLKIIGNYAFYSAGLTEIKLDGLQSTGSYSFYHCPYLKSVSISNCNTIGAECFVSCSSLSKVSLNSVETIGTCGFYDCSELVDLTLNNITTIGDGAFSRCTNLTSVYIDAVTIGGTAFAYSGLISVVIGKRVKTIYNSTSSQAFYEDSYLTSVTFENTVGWHYLYGTYVRSRDVTNSASNANDLPIATGNWYVN